MTWDTLKLDPAVQRTSNQYTSYTIMRGRADVCDLSGHKLFNNCLDSLS